MTHSVSRRQALQWLGAGTAATLAFPSAQAQAYPSRPVRVVVGASPGGPADFMARAFSDAATPVLGQPFMVDNKPGASGTIAANLAAKAAGDGHTLLIGAPGAIVVAPHLYAKLDYNPERDFQPVAMLGAGAFMLVAHPSVPANNLAELVALAKSKPGELNYGSGGNGSSGQLCCESFASVAGIEVQHVPYKGDGPAVNDLLAGRLQFMFTAPNVAMPHVKSGGLKALGVTSRERMSALPDVPSLHETIPGFEYLGWIVLFAPTGTPAPVIESLAGFWNQARQQPAIRDRFEALGMYPPASYAVRESLHGLLRAERQRTAVLVKKLGITPT
ncbi:MAG: tripartite tricarboxylate transporter substrate binding protein [Burkholderiaceae bacterium]